MYNNESTRLLIKVTSDKNELTYSCACFCVVWLVFETFIDHNSIDTMQSYWQPSNRAVARRIQNMGWRADGLLWLLVRGGEFILATALGYVLLQRDTVFL